jgi:hypothetical protein
MYKMKEKGVDGLPDGKNRPAQPGKMWIPVPDRICSMVRSRRTYRITIASKEIKASRAGLTLCPP